MRATGDAWADSAVGHAEILIAGLLVAVAGLSGIARFLSVPYPIALDVGGALFGFVPGLPEVRLDPEVVLVVFLPPLLRHTGRCSSGWSLQVPSRSPPSISSWSSPPSRKDCLCPTRPRRWIRFVAGSVLTDSACGRVRAPLSPAGSTGRS
jgi:hypothetical protein